MFIDFSGASNVSSAPVEPSIPSGGAVADVFYNLGTIISDPNITLAAVPSDGKLHEYMFQFSIGPTVPASITFPASVIFPDTPSWEANKTYQISIVNNLAAVMSWPNA